MDGDHKGSWDTFAAQICRAMGLKSAEGISDGTRAVIDEKYRLAKKAQYNAERRARKEQYPLVEQICHNLNAMANELRTSELARLRRDGKHELAASLEYEWSLKPVPKLQRGSFGQSKDSFVAENHRANQHAESVWEQSAQYLSSNSVKARLLRQGVRCWYCDIELTVKIFTWDHVVPRSKGGRGSDNYVPACKKCNEEKDSATEGWFKDCRKPK